MYHFCPICGHLNPFMNKIYHICGILLPHLFLYDSIIMSARFGVPLRGWIRRLFLKIFGLLVSDVGWSVLWVIMCNWGSHNPNQPGYIIINFSSFLPSLPAKIAQIPINIRGSLYLPHTEWPKNTDSLHYKSKIVRCFLLFYRMELSSIDLYKCKPNKGEMVSKWWLLS